MRILWRFCRIKKKSNEHKHFKTGISKQKRDDLITKVKPIRTYIAEAPQDKNTGVLLTCLSKLEKEVKSKKYGSVFEEHREGIDEILDTYVPILVEDKKFTIE